MFRGKTVLLSAESGVPEATAMLLAGGTVAFPTETVYGLGANALDAGAVPKIFEAKERPGWDPLIVHVCDEAMLSWVAEISGDIAPKIREPMAAFWPGPLTLLLPRTQTVAGAVASGPAVVGGSVPGHSVAWA